MSLLLLPSCASSKKSEPAPPRIVWPSPPDDARISYMTSIAQPSDVGLKKTGWSRFARWIIGTTDNDTLVKPFGIALDEADNLCFTDTGANAVFFFNATEKKWHRWDKLGKTRFASPVAVAKRGDTLFVADSVLRKIFAFNTRGKLLFQITAGLERPSGLTIAGEHLFVIDSQLSRVLVYDLSGKPAFQFGQRGAGPGEFNFPTHIAADGKGGVLVTDSLNSRIQIFDGQGHHKGTIGSSGDSPGHFGRPKGVATDNFGHLYVIDALFDNFQIFDRGGRLLLSVGEAGSQPGEFWLPNGIAISRDNRIFITDSYNRRIQVFQYIGAL